MTVTPKVQVLTLPTRDGPVTVRGVVLGEGSSRSELHNHATSVADPGQKCKACRWSEVKIIRLVETERDISLRTHPSRTGSVAESVRLRTEGPLLGAYIIHTVGMSVVPGEVMKTRLVRTTEPTAVLNALVVHKYESGNLVDTFVTRPAQDALDDAADADPDLDAVFRVWLTDPANAELLDAA
jgi:hypothetical protein